MTMLADRTRRCRGYACVAGLVVALAFTASRVSASAGTFGFARLRAEAQKRAREPYKPSETELPQAWRDLDYDGYRAITYRADKALWREEGLPFRVEFYHPGYLFRRPVKINILDGDVQKQVPFSTDSFDYSSSPAGGHAPSNGVGFAGFRLLYPINGPVDHEEFISFLGASYFRAVGRHQVYGASARGLALGMGAPDEEFPAFTEFWIEKPAAAARTITVFSLLDSPSVAGAYRFDIRPGADTIVAVRAEVFARKAVVDVGVAALTSMYFYGRNGPQRLRDERPQVHDSDGLLIAGERGNRTWRPLWNPHEVSLSDLQVGSIRGFGLMQRDRDPNHYQDPRTSYERRPSAWVDIPGPNAPAAGELWRQGVVRLLELPSGGEGQDNIGACWAPSGGITPQRALSIGYRLRFGAGAPQERDIGQVVATHWSKRAEGGTRFEVEFEWSGPAPEAKVSTTKGQVVPAQVRRDPTDRYWRVEFDFTPPAEGAAELRTFLASKEGHPLTETWSFAWPR